jgi:hypothetical protein
MFPHAKDINLLVGTVPVAPDALKEGGAVVKGMCHNTYLGFRQGNKLFMKICIRKHGSNLLSQMGFIIAIVFG